MARNMEYDIDALKLYCYKPLKLSNKEPVSAWDVQ